MERQQLSIPGIDGFLSDAWDRLDEKTVQRAIQSSYPRLSREVSLGVGFADFVSPTHRIIELKKSFSDKGKRYLTRPSHSIGQVLYYRSCYASLLKLPCHKIPATILIYGSSVGSWAEESITKYRQDMGIDLWVLVSLANSEVVCYDSGTVVNLEID